jgi:hypothetical protein
MAIPEIKKQLAVEFEIGPEALNNEIQTVLNNLVQEGLGQMAMEVKIAFPMSHGFHKDTVGKPAILKAGG